MQTADLDAIVRRIWPRIIPLLALALLCNYLDKINIGFAALQMNAALGLSNTSFGLAAGCFALGYASFAVPSTLLLHRFGGPRWIAFLMVTWGLSAAATAFVRDATSLCVARFVLGAAEAGFVPGAILYLGYWFPSEHRGRALGAFLIVQPLGMAIGGPVSSLIFTVGNAGGLAAWQWLFILEALPTVLLAGVVLACLPSKPAAVAWLTPAEKQRLHAHLATEAAAIKLGKDGSPAGALRNGRVWQLAAVNLLIGTSAIGAIFFLPLIVRSTGFSVVTTGFVAAIPSIAAAIALPAWGYWVDRTRRREGVVAVSVGMLIIGLIGTAACLPSPVALLPITIAMVGFSGSLVAFWTLPSAFLTGAGAAAGIALINVAGNMGTFVGPSVLGFIADHSGSYALGLLALALLACLSILILLVPMRSRAARPEIQTNQLSRGLP
jgi:ACS family tartrate transporter-like MFS transporter